MQLGGAFLTCVIGLVVFYIDYHTFVMSFLHFVVLKRRRRVRAVMVRTD